MTKKELVHFLNNCGLPDDAQVRVGTNRVFSLFATVSVREDGDLKNCFAKFPGDGTEGRHRWRTNLPYVRIETDHLLIISE